MPAHPRRLLAVAIVVLLVAPTRAHPPGGPCAFTDIDVARWGRQPFRNPPDRRAAAGRLETRLTVTYTDPSTVSIAGCPVTLRTYEGQLVGPTLRLKPGDVLDLVLDNRLPVETPDQIADQFAQEDTAAFIVAHPHSFNTTNLHTHGLHVSPVGNSDNVLLAIAPQSAFPYEILVPRGHPAGSFWYHAHTHGSTAMQVGSGMAGALIIEDDSTAIPAALREANRREKILVIQTILYDTTGRADHVAAFFPDPSPQGDTLCPRGNPNCTWGSSRRRTTINGQIVPRITMRPGEVQRWRLIDAAFRESMYLRLEGHALHEIALDGIYLGRVDTWGPQQTLHLEPGYRSDVLVQAGRPGVYQLVDAGSPPDSSLRGVAEPEEVIAELVIEGAPLPMPLPSSQEMAGLAPFGADTLQPRADAVQQVVFKLGSSPDSTESRVYFQVNYAAFDPSRIRYLRLGAVDQWAISTVGDSGVIPGGIPPALHIFHIHINPFQVTRAGPDGRPELVWKDTQAIPAGTTVNLFTRYTDYVGQFVLHCHILDHEDLGMMEVVEVVRRP